MPWIFIQVVVITFCPRFASICICGFNALKCSSLHTETLFTGYSRRMLPLVEMECPFCRFRRSMSITSRDILSSCCFVVGEVISTFSIVSSFFSIFRNAYRNPYRSYFFFYTERGEVIQHIREIMKN